MNTFPYRLLAALLVGAGIALGGWAVGQGIDWWEAAGVRMPVRPGDHVVFPAQAGNWVEVDEERLLVCRVTELLGVLENARDPETPELGGEVRD